MIINVKMTRPENIDYYGVRLGDTVPLELEDYLCGVVPSEVYESRTPTEALKAQAICARTYALRKHLDGATMDDTANNQAYRVTLAKDSPRSAGAVRATEGLVLMHGGDVIQCYYSNNNGGRTKRTEEVWSKALPYYASRDDPWDVAARFGKDIKASHGVGLSQVGAEYAAEQGRDCNSILAFYYPGAEVARLGGGLMEYEIKVDMHTQNDCYKAARVRNKTHIFVHSTGTQKNGSLSYLGRWYKWNTPGLKKCANAFVDWNGIYQTLPWNYQSWVNGVGAANDCGIAFEICEPSVKDDTPEMAADLYSKTLYLCTYLAREYSIPPENILCHAEAYKLGLATNHGDVNHWWGKRGTSWEPYTMDRLRADVAAELGYVEEYPYQARVATKTTPLNLWNIASTNTAQRRSLGTAPKDSIVTVLGRASLPNWYLAQYGDVIGNADGRYLQQITPTVDETDDDEDFSGSEAPVLASVVVPGLDEAARDKLLAEYPNAYLMEVNG